MKALQIIGLTAVLSISPCLAAPNSVETSSSSGGLFDKSMNPAMSFNTLLLGAHGAAVRDMGFKPGLSLQEIEARFTASVDPYFTGDLSIAADGGGKIGVEQAFLSTMSLPSVTVKAGKFLSTFGKNNTIHNHAQALIDRPLANRTILGGELNSIGLEASVLVPTSWYFDLTVGAISARSFEEGTSGELTGPFKATDDQALAALARMEHLFDLTDETTLAFGSSYTGGDNAEGRRSNYAGVDLTLKYRSGQGKGTFALSWTNEVIHGWRNGIAEWEKGFGAYSTVLARLHPKFWIGARADYVNTTADVTKVATGENLIVAYVPSEFSALRLQSGLLQSQGKEKSDWLALLQFNMTIGAHPAHAY